MKTSRIKYSGLPKPKSMSEDAPILIHLKQWCEKKWGNDDWESNCTGCEQIHQLWISGYPSSDSSLYLGTFGGTEDMRKARGQ
jgi:hypothetical protein